MLVISRHVREKVLIGDDIFVQILEIKGNNTVRLGIEAPDDVKIFREEILKDKDDNHGNC